VKSAPHFAGRDLPDAKEVVVASGKHVPAVG
jgi:hypothetical protein